MEHHQDEHITCAECGTTFVFTAAEADSFASKRLEPPKRCPECRRARRAQKAAGGRDAAPRGHFGGDVNGYRSPMSDPTSGRGGSGEYRSPGFRDSRPPEGNRGGPSSGGRGEYRAPGFGGDRGPRGGGEYRAPSYAGDRGPRGGGEYRAPGFGGDRGPRPNGEYRAPGFGGDRGPRGGGEYRAPAFGGNDRGSYGDRGPRGGGGGFRGGPRDGGPRRGPAPGGAPRGDRRDGRGPGPSARPHGEGGHASPRPERPSYPITCAQCGAAAEVPFKPQEGREILCRDCYRAKKDAAT